MVDKSRLRGGSPRSGGSMVLGQLSPSSSMYLRERAQRSRRWRLRLLRRKEYNRLRSMVPSIAAKPKVSKVTVIEEAIKYIDHLHCALISRLQTKGMPQALQDVLTPSSSNSSTSTSACPVDQRAIRDFIRQMLPVANL